MEPVEPAQPPSGVVELRRPPDLPAVQPVNPLTRLLPVVMLVAIGGMAAVYLNSGQGTSRNPMFLLFPVMMLASAMGTLAHTFRGRTAEVNAARCGYLRYLDDVVEEAAKTARRQRDWLHWRHPDPAALWTVAGGPRMWERRPGDPDFGVIRFGLGPAPLATPLIAPEPGPADDIDPVTDGALRDVLERWALLDDVPVTLAVGERDRVPTDSDPVVSRNMVRAMVCQLATLHRPTDVRIAAVVPPGDTHWDWLKWLPHHRDPLVLDGAGPRRLTFTDLAAAQDACAALDAVRVVIVVDGVDVSDTAIAAGVTVFDVGAAPASVTADCRPDELGPGPALRCARRIAGHAPDGGPAAPAGWPELIGVASGDFDPAQRWRPRADEHRLRVPIGFTTTPGERGQPVTLDIKEAAHGGMGPHGLCIGATGSGKSEFLRTLILGLIATHPPDELNLALIDYKGGATFLGLDRAAHVAAVITNLADEAHLVDRMRDALTGEMNRRQELLRAAGNLAGVHDYRRARAAGADLPALPVLFIVVDEFSELLSQQPDFADLFVAIGRVGRSLGMHLLLASQRFDEGRMRGLDTHLSYRVCLRTFSTGESRAVLGIPDAYQLPAAPGAAYLRTPTGETVRFHTAYVSGPVAAPVRTPAAAVRPFTAAPVPDRSASTPGRRSTLLDTVLDRMAGHGAPAHRVWLPPLKESPSLGDLLRAHGAGPLRVPVGLVDNPFAQRHDALLIDLTGATGHAAVVGATRSGKSTALCSIVLALAATHHPGEVQCYLLDFGGGGLASLEALPHTGVYAGRADTELARRAVRHLHDLLRRREANGPDDQGEVFLVVDGWAAMRQVCDGGDGLEDAITALAAQGLAHGIHVVIAASRWAELRPALKDQLGTRIELRLGEPTESEMDRKRARLLADRGPGACLTRDGLFSLIARPTLFGLDTGAAVQALRVRHGDVAAPRIEVLPAKLTWPDGAPPPATAGVVPIGIGESAMHTVTIDFAEHQHLIVLGDIGCGKTAALRTLCLALTSSGGPDDVQLLIVDYRRALLGVVQSAHLAGYAISADAVQSRLEPVLQRLRDRRPGIDVTQRQLRDRSWWSGPDIYVVVDDYDLVAAASGNPLGPLLEYLPHARDLGLHVIVARRSGGAARALFDPLLAAVRELGGAGLMMSAGPEEGVLLGSTRPVRLPPGRATLSVRGAPDERVQIAWADPP
ncbi:type VII secretion protein EccCb [Mycolicibacterium cosmeticum]|uniref:Cell division protein FtsK n=1 Tax=Mycolicibacterium cosmeticum TaxID=258533 RepID=W9AVI3_MYCCO|nr:type VII secretion protein EccCb [Mycolicibacterium cosmeticum]TLH74512.1 type VII secretion protein EccCb [Mycolicibacterium cosmeticum]CDO09839.1 cell division protein FtsK [Mycolicibacterium cosmeticum]